jgi:hypothetical protein
VNVNFGDNTVYLERGEVLEVVLANGHSIWVNGDGTVQTQRKEKA